MSEQTVEYSIATFLETLADDDLERVMIKLISKGTSDEELLKKLLALMRGIKK